MAVSPDLEGCVFDYEGIVLGVGEVQSAGTAALPSVINHGLDQASYHKGSSVGAVSCT